jgi:hypothetical protein
LEQSKDATKIMVIHRQVIDHESEFTMRTNRHPNFKKSSKVFFLRGSEKDKNDKEVITDFRTPAKAQEALAALKRLIENVKMPEGVDPEHTADKEPMRGGTSDVRMAFITKAQAMKLHLTANKYFKEERRWRNDTKPITTVNYHYNEHIGQVVDVLNKAFGADRNTKGVVHANKINNAECKWAYEAICNMFDEAEKRGDGHLIALWRALTGLRGPDHVDRSELPSTHR